MSVDSYRIIYWHLIWLFNDINRKDSLENNIYFGERKMCVIQPINDCWKKPQTHKICGRNCQRKIRLTFILNNLFTLGQLELNQTRIHILITKRLNRSIVPVTNITVAETIWQSQRNSNRNNGPLSYGRSLVKFRKTLRSALKTTTTTTTTRPILFPVLRYVRSTYTQMMSFFPQPLNCDVSIYFWMKSLSKKSCPLPI